jgi:hypothetical protein
MAINNRIIQVHPDAIIEYIWDDTFFYSEDYSIVRDVRNNVSNFTFGNNIQDNENYNKIPNQLYLIDAVTNRYGIADPSINDFLHEQQYTNIPHILYEKVKIWFPLNYVFPTSVGFYLRTGVLNYENRVEYNFSNFFLDITQPGELSKIQNETTPFRFNEKLWGKSITIYVPSLNSEAQKRTNNAPTLGSINHQITNGDLGLSQTSPIFLDFRFLQSKREILGETTYITTPERVISIPQTPQYNNLSVQIQRADDGDYFKINGLYNGTINGFDQFMKTLDQSGKRSYILYSITVFEENIPQEPRDIYVWKDFWKGVDDYRPLFKFSNTTAGIRVDMKLINSVDNSVITKSTELAIVGNEVAKYSKNITSINVSNAIKPKLYNSKPDILMLPENQMFFTKNKNKNLSDQIKLVPYPVLTNIYDIVASEANVQVSEQEYKGLGQLQLNLTPFDNIIKLNLFKNISNSVIPFEIPSSNSIVQMVFKSRSSELRIPLYIESNEVNLKTGILVFKIPMSEQSNLRKIRAINSKFYITLTTNGVESNLYDGIFILLQDLNRVTSQIKEIKDRISLTNRDVKISTFKGDIKVDKITNINSTSTLQQTISKPLNLSALKKLQ